MRGVDSSRSKGGKPGLSTGIRPSLAKNAGTGQQNVSWPALARPPTTLHKPHRKIDPLRIPSDDQSHLPGPRPTFQTGFALYGREYVAVGLAVNQAMQLIATGECRSGAILMCPHTASKTSRYADIQRPVRAIGHNVYPGSVHSGEHTARRLRKSLRRADSRGLLRSDGCKVVGGRDKPRHDTTVGPHPVAMDQPRPVAMDQPRPVAMDQPLLDAPARPFPPQRPARHINAQ